MSMPQNFPVKTRTTTLSTSRNCPPRQIPPNPSPSPSLSSPSPTHRLRRSCNSRPTSAHTAQGVLSSAPQPGLQYRWDPHIPLRSRASQTTQRNQTTCRLRFTPHTLARQGRPNAETCAVATVPVTLPPTLARPDYRDITLGRHRRCRSQTERRQH